MSVNRIGGIAAVAVFACSVGYLVAQYHVNAAAEVPVRELADKIEAESNGLEIDFKSVDAPIFGNQVSVLGVDLKNADGNTVFGISSVDVTVDGFVKNEKFPTSGEISINELEIVGERAKRGFNQGPVKYADSIIDINVGYSFDQAADTLSGYSTVTVPDLSESSAGITISNVAGIWEALEANYAENEGKVDMDFSERREVQKMLPQVKLNKAAVTYTNNGEIEELFAGVSEQEGMTVEELKAEIPRFVDYYVGDKAIAGELKTFLADPGMMSVSMIPAEPVSPGELVQRFMMASMGNTDRALDGLGLEVKAN